MLANILEEVSIDSVGNDLSLMCLFGLLVLGRTALSKAQVCPVKSLKSRQGKQLEEECPARQLTQAQCPRPLGLRQNFCKCKAGPVVYMWGDRG